jgi:hypothetical protein
MVFVVYTGIAMEFGRLGKDTEGYSGTGVLKMVKMTRYHGYKEHTPDTVNTHK